VLTEALAGRGNDLIDVACGIRAERPAVYCPVHLLRVATPGRREPVTRGFTYL